MADDVNLASPTGIVAADDIGSKLYQKIKAGWGPDNTWNETTTTVPFPVQLRSSSGTEGSIIQTVAHGVTDIGDPLKVGYRATATLAGATLVTAGQRSDGICGLDGAQIVRTHCNLEDIVTSNVVSCTSGANTSIVAAQGSGVKFYLTSVVLFNNGTANGSCSITDGNGGTVKLKLPFPASTGTVYNPPVPIGFTANQAVYADPSGSDTIDVTIIGFKSKV